MSRPRFESKRSPSAAFPWVLLVGGLGLAYWYVQHRSPEIAPGRVELSRLTNRRVQNTVALNGIAGGAAAGQRYLQENEEPASVESPLRIRLSAATAYCAGTLPESDIARDNPAKPPPAIRICNVLSPNLYQTREAALAAATEVAQGKLTEVFAALRPPIHTALSLEEVNEFIERDSISEQKLTEQDKAALRKNGPTDDREIKVRLAVSVSEDQLRQLRARQRLYDLSRWALAILTSLLIAYGALRADAGSQGYLTWLWAGLGVVLVGGVVTLAIVL